MRKHGHNVYDFKHPKENIKGFSWDNIDPDWRKWDDGQYQKALAHPMAEEGFNKDFNAMMNAEVCVLLLPCGKSAHSVAGFMAGMGKKVVVVILQPQEAELMYKLFDKVVFSTEELFDYLDSFRKKDYHDNFLVFNLTVESCWYNMILDNIKKEEYRKIKPYWIKRLFDLSDKFDVPKGMPMPKNGKITDEIIQMWKDDNINIQTLIKNKVIIPKKFTHIRFRWGYTNTTVVLKYNGLRIGVGKPEWGAPKDEEVLILQLGDMYELK